MPETSPQVAEQVKVREMLEAEEWYDLLPIEKKLIGWSLGIGIVLLIIFILIFVVFK
jgi:hypothetical protein